MIFRPALILFVLFVPCGSLALDDNEHPKEEITHGLSLPRPPDEEINGSLAIKHLVQLGIDVPGIELMFAGKSKAEFEQTLIKETQENNIMVALYLLHFMSAGWLDFQLKHLKNARHILTARAKFSNDQSTFINPYLKYYTQALRFIFAKNHRRMWFSQDNFNEAYLLKLPFQFSSLVMEVFGQLLQIIDDIKQEKITPSYFVCGEEKSFSRTYEALVLANAFLKEEQLFPRFYHQRFKEILKAIETSFLSIFPSKCLLIPSLSNGLHPVNIQDFFSSLESKVNAWLESPQNQIPVKANPKKSCFKKEKNTKGKKVQWASSIVEKRLEDYPTDEKGKVPKHRAPELSEIQQSLWYQLIDAFRSGVPLKAALQKIYMLNDGLSFTLIAAHLIKKDFHANMYHILSSPDLREAMENSDFHEADTKSLRDDGSYKLRYTDSEIPEEKE